LPPEETNENSQKKVIQLRHIANELRISGNLSQAIEAFRRALLWQPDNGALLHDFARGLHSYAIAARSSTWTHRAMAALRLASKRSASDSTLLTRIGESYLQFGSFDRASKNFQQALEIDAGNFRAECGLAEIALQNGKLAHVVHHYQAAIRIAPDAAAKKRAQTEADYFVLLSSNEDYLEAEVSRLSWLQSAARGKRVCFRLTFVGFILLSISFFGENELAALGWAISLVALLIWAILSTVAKFLSERFLLDEVEDE
jgi:tetratricopeptide (TPR) repeat protein